MAQQIVLSNVDYSTKGLGWFGRSWPEMGALQWAGFLGTGWPMDDTWDYSGRRQSSTVVGTMPRGTGYATPSTSSYYSLPYTDRQILEAKSSGSFTFAAVMKRVAATSTALISTYNTSTTAGTNIAMYSSGTIELHHYENSLHDQVTLGPGSSLGSYEFVAGVYDGAAKTMTAYRRGAADSSMLTSTGGLTNTGALSTYPRTIYVGRNYSTGYAGGGANVSTVAIYNRALSSVEITRAYTGLRTFLAGYGIGI